MKEDGAPIEIIARRDGQAGLAVLEITRFDRIGGSFDFGVALRVRLRPKERKTRIVAAIDDVFLSQLDEKLQPDQTREDLLFQIALQGIGEWIDEHGLPPFVDSGEKAALISVDDAAQSYFDPSGKPQATDAEIMALIGSKVYWGWCHGLTAIPLAHADARRLGVPRRELARVALAGDEVYWTRPAPDAFVLTPTSKLIQDVPAGAFPQLERPILPRILDRLAAPRYAAAREHFAKAVAFHDALPADLPNAVKEATSAVESLALRVLGRSAGTLGDCIKDLRNRSLLSTPLAKALEGLWGYASEQPGVRHGKTTTPAIPPTEAYFAINLAASAVLLLLDLDT